MELHRAVRFERERSTGGIHAVAAAHIHNLAAAVVEDDVDHPEDGLVIAVVLHHALHHLPAGGRGGELAADDAELRGLGVISSDRGATGVELGVLDIPAYVIHVEACALAWWQQRILHITCGLLLHLAAVVHHPHHEFLGSDTTFVLHDAEVVGAEAGVAIGGGDVLDYG